MKTIKTLLLALMLAAAPAWANLGADDDDESKNADWLEGKKAVEAKDYARAVPLLSKAAAAPDDECVTPHQRETGPSALSIA